MFSRYISFCLDVLVMKQNGLIRKIKLISNFMTSHPGQQISRNKGKQTMKFDELIEYTRFFLQATRL